MELLKISFFFHKFVQMTYWSKTEFIAYSIYNDVITLPCIRTPCHKLAQNFGQNIESLQNHCDKFCENYSVNVSHVSHDDWRSGTVPLHQGKLACMAC